MNKVFNWATDYENGEAFAPLGAGQLDEHGVYELDWPEESITDEHFAVTCGVAVALAAVLLFVGIIVL